MNARFPTSYIHRRLDMIITSVLLVVTALDLRADQAFAATARVRHSVHPVLIRKTENPVLRISVDAGNPTGLELKSISVGVSGGNVDADVQSLQLFSTGKKKDFVNSKLIAERPPTAGPITFSCRESLTADVNTFWVSVRLKPTASLEDSILVNCTSIETSSGVIKPLNETEPVAHRIGVALRQHNEDGVHTYRIPALATSTRKTLHCVYDVRRRMGRDLQEDIDIGLSRSLDGGQTWQPMQTIMDMGEYNGLPQEQNGCSDPGIIVDQKTGEIFVFAVWMWGKPGKHQWKDDGSEPGYEIGKAAQFLMVRSKDDGATWSKPENLTRALKQEAWWLLAPSPQQGINLPDGTLVMPVQGRDEKGIPFATIMTSEDHGASWIVRSPACGEGNECQAAMLADGSIMLNIRNDIDRFRAVYVTRDLGQTWTPHPTNRNLLIEPNCNASLYRFNSFAGGKDEHLLLFANPHTQKGRTHHTVQVSFDEGLTWPDSHHLLLDEGRGAGYPSITRIDDQHVGIVYEGSQSHLTFERLSLSELLTAKVNSTRSPGTTSLTNSNVNFTEPAEHSIQIARSGVTAVFADNSAIQDGPAAGHKAGYNGVAFMARTGMDKNIFVPSYAGLNFEHIHDGTKTVDREKFEPRVASMKLRRVDAFTVEMYQPPTPNWQLESCGRYQMLDDGAIEYTFECIPRSETFQQNWIGLFWASYIESPSDPSIWFPGRAVSEPNAKPIWLNTTSPKHGVDATHPPAGFARELQIPQDFSLTLVNHPSKYVYTEPWFYGVRDGFAFVQMFRSQDRVWLAQSPTGGGKQNPAWDFQWFTESAVVNQPYGLVMRAAVVPFSTHEQLERDMADHLRALGIRK